MKEFTQTAKALADENRIRVLLALAGRELCVCQLIELLGLAPSTVSKHLAILKQAGLVEIRKDGRWIYYRLAGGNASQAVRGALAWVATAAGRTRRAEADRKRLERIVKFDKVALCRRLLGDRCPDRRAPAPKSARRRGERPRRARNSGRSLL